MPPDFLIFIAGVVVANLVLLAAAVAAPRERRDRPQGDLLPATRPEGASKYESPAAVVAVEQAPAAYERVLRILWWVTIAAVLVGVGVSGAFVANQALIFALGGLAVVAVLVLHELLPERWRRAAPKFWLEAIVAVGFVTGLLVLTGYGRSPFFFTFPLVAVAVALARGGRATFFFAAFASLAYVGVLALDPQLATFTAGDLLSFGLNVGSIWLLAYLAAVFAGQERRMRAGMLQLSLTDPLTGLFNRTQIYSTLEQEIRRTRRSERGFCLLMIDLDGLKAVNDSLGHHRGDDVLVSLGRVIRGSIRTVDTAYRYGGDEFMILLPETDIAGAYVVAEKIRSGVEEIGIALGEEHLPTSVSIGLVSHPEDGQTVEELMIAADRAMYAAKSLGKNQISGYPRPRRIPPSLPPLAGLEAEPTAAPSARREAPMASTQQPVGPGLGPSEPAVAVETVEESAPAEAAAATPRTNGHGETGDDEDLTPAEARRRIAALSYDPDHQIRRAMDAFLGGPSSEPPEGH